MYLTYDYVYNDFNEEFAISKKDAWITDLIMLKLCATPCYTVIFRIGYAVFLLKKLIEEEKDNKIFAMYDIACVLIAHLKVILWFI